MGAPKKWTRMAPGTPVSSGDDRRSVRRYTIVQARAWLGWWEGEEFRSTTAQLTDISLRGCMMTVDQLPPAGQPVRFCPPGTTPSDWIEAELIESKRRLLGPRMVRLSFRNPFPYETFKNVVYGSAKVGGLAPSATWAPEKGRDYR